MKELCPDILTKDTNPIEFRKFQQDFVIYYKESHMENGKIIAGRTTTLSPKVSRCQIGRAHVGNHGRQHSNF